MTVHVLARDSRRSEIWQPCVESRARLQQLRHEPAGFGVEAECPAGT
jgi:hypothetical protein